MDDDFPPYVRDSATSYAAAASVEATAASIRATVYRAIYDARGLTCDEAEQLLGLRHQTCSARVWELHHKMGLIIDSNLRRRTRSNRWAVVWIDKATLGDPMRHFITGCSIAVPVAETAAEGFVQPDAAKNACAEMAGELPRLLIAQTHDQAKAACAGCPRCGPIAPHLAVAVGDDRMRTLAETPEPPAPKVTVVRKRADGTEAPVGGGAWVDGRTPDGMAPKRHDDAGAFARPTAEPEPPPLATVSAAPSAEPVAPAAPSSGRPSWLEAMLQAAGASPAPEPITHTVGGIPVVDTPGQLATVSAPPAAEPEPAPVTETPPGHPDNVFRHEPEPPPPEPEPAAVSASAPVHPVALADSQVANGWTVGWADPGTTFDAAMTHPRATPPMLSLLPPEVNTGPSVMGSSTLRAFQLCMRAGFYRIMKGIRRRRQTEWVDDRGTPQFDPLALGTLVHQVLARFYEGAENPFAFLSAIAPHYPNIVEETRRLCTLHFNAYAERDRKLFDIRFVELESRYYFKKKRVKSAKKNLSLCVSSKHDLGFRRRPVDEPRLPPGVAASAITIMDHKTIGRMTQDAQTAYRHDPQIFTNAVTYERGNSVAPDGTLGEPSAARFGPLTHFAINLIGKAQHHDPNKHLIRLTQIIPRDLLDSYADDIEHWLYTELADRMFHPAAQDDETWPKSYLCRDPSTGRPCAYVELCERGGLKKINPAINYVIEPPYDPERLVRPEVVGKRGRKPRAKAAAEVERK